MGFPVLKFSLVILNKSYNGLLSDLAYFPQLLNHLMEGTEFCHAILVDILIVLYMVRMTYIVY